MGLQSSRSNEKEIVKQVLGLFPGESLMVLRVNNYQHLAEQQKEQLCLMWWKATLCKIPTRDGNGMLFFLRKEARV